jgi:hypothetical protein
LSYHNHQGNLKEHRRDEGVERVEITEAQKIKEARETSERGRRDCEPRGVISLAQAATC